LWVLNNFGKTFTQYLGFKWHFHFSPNLTDFAIPGKKVA